MSVLYKFIGCCDAVPFLLNGVVKFAPIPELNDPSELVPTLDTQAVVESRDRLRKEGYSDADMEHLRQQENLLQLLAPEYQAVNVPRTRTEATQLIRSPFYESIPTLERRLSETAREMASKVGVFCLSRRFDSLPMWAHYAANAAGLVIEFRDLEHDFQGDNTGVLRQLTPVDYHREVYGVTFDPESHRSLFFSKFSDWSYEEEVRVVLPLSECQTQNMAGKMLYTYEIPKCRIAQLILGWNMSPEDASTIDSLVKSNNSRVAVRQARFIRGEVSLG